jgi:hypothetical protein
MLFNQCTALTRIGLEDRVNAPSKGAAPSPAQNAGSDRAETTDQDRLNF